MRRRGFHFVERFHRDFEDAVKKDSVILAYCKRIQQDSKPIIEHAVAIKEVAGSYHIGIPDLVKTLSQASGHDSKMSKLKSVAAFWGSHKIIHYQWMGAAISFTKLLLQAARARGRWDDFRDYINLRLIERHEGAVENNKRHSIGNHPESSKLRERLSPICTEDLGHQDEMTAERKQELQSYVEAWLTPCKCLTRRLNMGDARYRLFALQLDKFGLLVPSDEDIRSDTCSKCYVTPSPTPMDHNSPTPMGRKRYSELRLPGYDPKRLRLTQYSDEEESEDGQSEDDEDGSSDAVFDPPGNKSNTVSVDDSTETENGVIVDVQDGVENECSPNADNDVDDPDAEGSPENDVDKDSPNMENNRNDTHDINIATDSVARYSSKWDVFRQRVDSVSPFSSAQRSVLPQTNHSTHFQVEESPLRTSETPSSDDASLSHEDNAYCHRCASRCKLCVIAVDASDLEASSMVEFAHKASPLIRANTEIEHLTSPIRMAFVGSMTQASDAVLLTPSELNALLATNVVMEKPILVRNAFENSRPKSDFFDRLRTILYGMDHVQSFGPSHESNLDDQANVEELLSNDAATLCRSLRLPDLEFSQKPQVATTLRLSLLKRLLERMRALSADHNHYAASIRDKLSFYILAGPGTHTEYSQELPGGTWLTCHFGSRMLWFVPKQASGTCSYDESAARAVVLSPGDLVIFPHSSSLKYIDLALDTSLIHSGIFWDEADVQGLLKSFAGYMPSLAVNTAELKPLLSELHNSIRVGCVRSPVPRELIEGTSRCVNAL